MTDPDTKKREIIAKGKLSGFELIINKLIDKIVASNCTISCCDTCSESSYSQSYDGKRKHITIGFKKERTKPIHVIWDILHEYGHFVSRKTSNDTKSIASEEAAWTNAYKELLNFKELENEISDFQTYKEYCLNTYRNQVK